jgi:glutaminyl-peptide cyclotransferase
VDPVTGAIIRAAAPPDDAYGEGLALVDDELVQLSWKEGLAFRWDLETFDLRGTYAYDGEGWGLCDDGERLVMSDGSATLTFRDRHTFEVLGTVAITLEGVPISRLNELECVGGEVWANVWETDAIVRIDPATGRVTGLLDTTGIIEPHPALADPGAVLNGIAHDPVAGTFLITGKRWPTLFAIGLEGDASS